MPRGQRVQLGVRAVPIGYAVGDAITDFYLGDIRAYVDDSSGRLSAGNIRERTAMMAAPMKTRNDNRCRDS